jgi:ABC-type polysaccharide/polyol phosphate transport system ATPase subunit
MARILLEHASLSFRLPSPVHRTLKELLFIHRLRFSRRTTGRVQALSDVNLDIRTGQKLGIIGHNGAGKSTLLRLIAGIYTPTEGRRHVEGRISSMLDIGLGIDPDATGWENIKFRGYLQRQSPSELARKAPEIAEFSELGSFLDAPVRCYSSGMSVRLLFSIATAIDPEILLLDEVFGAGDLSFQEKAQKRMMSLLERARIIVFASHDLVTIRNICQTAVWLDHGTVRMLGPADEVTRAYERHTHEPRQVAA